MDCDRVGKKTIFCSFVLLVTFCLIFLLNQRTVYTADDYMYHFFWEGSRPTNETRVLDRIADIPLSLKNHAEGFNSRVVSHALVMFFMMYDKMLFNVCNSLVYLLLGLLLLAYIEKNPRKWKSGYLAVIYLSMWVFLPVTGQSILWLSGACNYLWMFFLILIFFFPYRLYMENRRLGRCQVVKGLLIIPVGLLAGCSNENTGGAVVFLAFLFIGYWIWKRKKIPIWSITGILSAGMGVILLISASSSQNRIASETFQLTVFLKRMREIVGYSYHYILIPLIVLFIVAFILIKNRRENHQKWVDSLIIPFFYCVAGAASIVVLILSPVIAGKSWILAVCFMMIAIGQIYKEIRVEKYDIKRFTIVFLFLLSSYSFIRYVCAVQDINRTYKEVEEQIAMIEEQKAQGIMDVEVYILTPSKNISNATENTPNVSKESEDWFNQWMACYYGVNSIAGLERENR